MTTTKKKRGEDLPFGQESFARMMRAQYQFSHRVSVDLFKTIGHEIARTLEAGDSARLFDQFAMKIVEGTQGKKVRVRLAANSRLAPMLVKKERQPGAGRKRPGWTPPAKAADVD